MRIIDASSQDGTAGKPGSKFTGSVFPFLTMARTDDVTINNVNFTPGARTYWHSHEKGQILQVLAGRGLIQTEDEAQARVINAGDTVWCPPGERHWHGACADSYMVHIAISLGDTIWDEPVTDEQYSNKTEAEEETNGH